MTKQQALREAVRLWGKKSAVEDKGYETSDALRADAKAKLDTLRSLPACPPNTPESKERRRAIQKAASESCRKRYSVGEVESMCGLGMFFVHGQGDTWEEAFAEAARLAAPAKHSRAAKV